jgi:RNA polymerase sigma-70 factor (ECF subfamily)
MDSAHIGLAMLPSIDGPEGLFVRLAADDAAALDALLSRHWSPLLAYIKSLIGDPEEAQDIAQETFLYLWEGRGRWNPSGSARALLYRAARSRSLNYARHDRVCARSGPLVEAQQREQCWTPTPLQLLEQAELRSALEEAIETLPPRRREVFLLGYLHGCRHAEIAEIMRISEQTARNHMSAALADLRRILGPFLE